MQFADCPPEALVGICTCTWSKTHSVVTEFASEPVYNMVPPRGVAVQLGANFVDPLLFINNGVLAGGDYPIQATVTEAPASAPVIAAGRTSSVSPV